jgi:type IV pilus assembly protein PilN
MIRINLLPQKKSKRAARGTMTPSMRGRSSGGDGNGQTQFLMGCGALLVAGALVFFLVHKPMADERKRLEDITERKTTENNAAKAKLKDYENLKKVVESAKERSASIEKLVKAKAVPANLLQELGDILTQGRAPTMTNEMRDKVSDGPKGDPNKRYQADWDPKHVWITSFIEKGGEFTLKGGAQSDPDVTQLAKRLQASVYFMDVAPKGGAQTLDRDTGLQYYDFTITGKVVY